VKRVLETNKIQLRKKKLHKIRKLFFVLSTVLIASYFEAAADTIISDGEYFAGLDISEDGALVAISLRQKRQIESDLAGRLLILSLGDLKVIENLNLDEGLQPYDPRFSEDHRKILFAGYCEEATSTCAKHSPGWNIYTYDLDDKKLLRLTDPNPLMVRWRPVWGIDKEIYFVGFNKYSSLGLDSITSASGIFRTEWNLPDELIFPTGTLNEEHGSIYHPAGRISAVSILSVSKEGILLKARFAVTISPPDLQLSRWKKQGRFVDERLTDRAYESFYGNEERSWPLEYTTNNTVFLLTNKKFEILHENPQLRSKLPAALNTFLAAADKETIWIRPSTLDERFSKLFIRVKSDEVSLIGRDIDWPSGDVRGFDATPSMVAAVTQLKESGEIFLAFSGDWEESTIWKLR
jgi:hypothetical protein